MKIFSKLKDEMKTYLFDSSIDMLDRSFAVFAISISVMLLSSMIVGIFLGEPLKTTISLLLLLLASLLFFGLELKNKRVREAPRVVSALFLIFLYNPATFFLKGGLDSGAPVMMLTYSIFLVMILDGKIRWRLIGVNLGVVIACFLIGYYFPELITDYPPEKDYLYTLSTFIISGMVLSILIIFQSGLSRREQKIAVEKGKELEELNKSQNRFFSSMSHEIRTPINTVLGMNEIILRQEDASDEIKKDARNIQGAGKLLLALINDILDVSKIEAGKMDIVPVNYSVSALLSEIVNMIWLKAEEKGLEFRVDIDPNVPETLFGDEVRIKQILINLLNNAVKYTQKGAVRLHMECENAEEGFVLLKINVSDTGMGIKADAIPHLFDTFQRQDEEKNRYIEGTGLGLSIVKQLVELMGGEITVNSVYTQGSTFLVSVRQGVSSENRIGDINIMGGGAAGDTEKFEHSFHAPGARILIVDDNEMNLQVEQKLLDGTEMTVDLSMSGADALLKTLQYRYDVIFMDHLMPEMDGIECFEKIRTQSGGMNRQTPIVVLTANAGGENIELYNNTGFDGYLVKPVSGIQLENMLMDQLPPEKVISSTKSEMTSAQMNTASGYVKKKPLIIATSSMSDLPPEITRDLSISLIPFAVYTDEGTFHDNIDIDSDELVRYMADEQHKVTSEPPKVDEYIAFFSRELMKAHQLIYITLSTGSSLEYQIATEAARTFENVSVVNSELLSSGTGILVMIAGKLAQQNMPVDKIIEELEVVKKRIRCSFVIRSTDTMSRRGHIAPAVNNILKTLWLRPVLRVKNDKMGVGRFFLGNERRCYENYIKSALPAKVHPDTLFVFITYAGMEEEDLIWIREEVLSRVPFEHIVFQKASPGIASNCGPGTFGILYLEKSDRFYNIGNLFHEVEEKDTQEEELSEDEEFLEEEEEELAPFSGMPVAPEPESEPEPVEKKWYEEIPGMDAAAAIKNSGSEDAFLSVLKIYYDSYDMKSGEIEDFYKSEDWANYTIKVHALKSSSRLVGALKLGDGAEALEMAGKKEDIDYIRGHHEEVMDQYRSIRDSLAPQYGAAEEEDLPEVPPEVLADAYASMPEFVEMMDYELMKMVMDSVKEYKLPPEDAERFKKLDSLLAKMDWEGIKELLKS